MGVPAPTNNESEKKSIVPTLFKPLSDLGVKLNITENTFAKGQDAFRVFRDEKTLNDFAKENLPNKAVINHKDYLDGLLRIAKDWNLIDLDTFIKESARLARYADGSTPDLLNQRLGFKNNTNLLSKLKDDTRSLAVEVVGAKKFEPVKDALRKLPDGWAKEMSLKYIDFREKNAKEQWQIAGRNSLKAAIAVGRGTKKAAEAAGTELKNFVIFNNLDFWNDESFKRVYGRSKQFVRQTVVEPVKVAVDQTIKQPVQAARDRLVDFDQQVREFHKSGKWPGNVNNALASDGIFRKRDSGDEGTVTGQRIETRNGKKKQFNIISFALESTIKGITIPLKFAFQRIRPAVQATEFVKRGVTSVKGWMANVARPFMSERFEGLRNGFSSVSKFVRNGVRATSNVVGALGDAAVPAAITLIATGNPIAAIAVGSASLSGSLTTRFLNASTLPIDYSLARETVFKYGSYAGKMDVMLKNLKDFGGAEWQKPDSRLLTTVREEVAREGGASKVYMGASALRALGLGMTLGFAFGLGPIGAVGMGLAFAGGNFATSYLTNRFLISPQYLNMAKFGLSQMPVNQILGVYFGGKWLEDQIKKLLANPKKWWREEWANFSLTGGFGNLITGATTLTSAASVGRWAANSVIAIAGGETASPTVVAAVGRSMAVGGALGSLVGAGLGWLVFGIPPGIGAIVGGFVGSVAGGIIGAGLTGATGGAAAPLIFGFSFLGGGIGAFLGTGIDWLVDNARKIAEAFASFLGILSIAKFIATLASILTAPLRRLTDYVELVVPIALGLITIAMMAIGTSQTATNTPLTGSTNTSNSAYENTLASIISPIVSDISSGGKQEKLELTASKEFSVSSCFASATSYYIKKGDNFAKLQKSGGLTFSGSQNNAVISPFGGIVFYKGESPLYVRETSGKFVKAGEEELILAPSSLTSSYFILVEGVNSNLNTTSSFKKGSELGISESGSFRVSVLTSAEVDGTYSHDKFINPCLENSGSGFPGFTCDIIPQFSEVCE